MLMSASELAREFEVSRQLVHTWKKKADFPKPVQVQYRTLGRGTPVWDPEEVRAWREKRLTASSS